MSSQRSVRRVGVGALVFGATLFAAACSRPQAAAGVTGNGAQASAEQAPRPSFDVRADSSDLTFFWFDDRGNAHSVSRVGDVPQQFRGTVRVDPSRPELRTPGWIFVTDLRAPGADGRFGVHALTTEQFTQELASLTGVAMPSGGGLQPRPSATAAPNGQARVVIYGASWCTACHQAAAWLRSQGIPFVEHDIETEPGAAQEMMTRAREQGVPTGSIPIIAINGRLTVGFSPDTIQRLMAQGG